MAEQIPFAATVRAGLERAVAKQPALRLLVRDSDMNTDKATANVTEFAERNIDLGIIYHVDERANPTLANILMRRAIPVITVDVPIAPWITYFGADNERTGRLVGEQLCKWIKLHWEGEVEKVIVLADHRVLAEVRKRTESALFTLTETVRFSADDVLHLDAGNVETVAYERVLSVLERWHNTRKIAIIAFNDDTALGALKAARAHNRERDVVVVGQGADRAIDELRRPDSRLIASTAFFPERYGDHLVDLALRIFKGEKLEKRYTMEHVCVTPANVEAFITDYM